MLHTKKSFDFNGNVSVNISKMDYLNYREDLARTSHTQSTAPAHIPMTTASDSIVHPRCSYGYTSGVLHRLPCIHRHLHRFVKIECEKCGLNFDHLCHSLGELFIEFLDLHRKGLSIRIVDRMDAVKTGPVS